MTAGSCVQLLCCTLSDEILKGSSDQKSDLNQPHTAESHTNARIFFKVWHSTSFACVPRIHHKYHRATCRVLKTWKVNPRVKLFRYKRWLLRLPLYHFYCYMARLVVWILNDLGLSFLILSAKGDKIFLFFTIAASLLTAHYLSDVNCIRPDNSLYRRLRYSKGIFFLYYLKVVWQRSPLRYKQVQAWRNWYFEIRTNQTDEIIFYTFPS